MHSLNGVKNMKRFVVVRAEGYMTSRPASSVFVYTKTILRCKILVGDTQTLELHPLDAGLASPNEKVYDSNTLSAIGKRLFPVKKENSDD